MKYFDYRIRKIEEQVGEKENTRIAYIDRENGLVYLSPGGTMSIEEYEKRVSPKAAVQIIDDI